MDQKDFTYTALKLEVQKALKIEELYQLCKTLIPLLQLSNNAVRYYGSLAEQYTASRLRKLKKPQRSLHMLCFIFHRYQEFMDNLITSFMFHRRAFVGEAKEHADAKEQEFIKGLMLEFPNLGQFLMWFSCQETKPDLTKEEFIKLGFDILPKEKQMAIADLIWGNRFDKEADDTDEAEKSTFFDDLPKRDIADVFKFMGDFLRIWMLFEGQKDRYVKHKHPSPLALIACILADAFGFGTEKMSQMSNIGYNHLVTIDENFMYVENLKLINDAFSNYIHGLPVSRAWDLIENTNVSDADGQKYATSYHTIQSRFSSKYFGSCKGISIYSLTTNHISVNAKVIGPNEHESHHLYDVIFNNKTNIPIHMVTGDGHSINQTSFVTLDSM